MTVVSVSLIGSARFADGNGYQAYDVLSVKNTKNNQMANSVLLLFTYSFKFVSYFGNVRPFQLIGCSVLLQRCLLPCISLSAVVVIHSRFLFHSVPVLFLVFPFNLFIHESLLSLWLQSICSLPTLNVATAWVL